MGTTVTKGDFPHHLVGKFMVTVLRSLNSKVRPREWLQEVLLAVRLSSLCYRELTEPFLMVCMDLPG
jgi:hypothetical protein